MTQVERHEDTRRDIVKVKWDAPTTEKSGNSNILSYKLVWDAGTGVVDEELTSVTTYFPDIEFAITEGLIVGQEYLFQV